MSNSSCHVSPCSGLRVVSNLLTADRQSKFNRRSTEMSTHTDKMLMTTVINNHTQRYNIKQFSLEEGLKKFVERLAASFRECERWGLDGSLPTCVICVSLQTSVVPKFSSQRTNCHMGFFSSQLHCPSYEHVKV
jgi:hypothetical protein